ncbi:MAG: hypothetical protein PF481_10760 [Bacteroidales bacterium]|jgi:hypothetical protein|nr:hypothetical protein [Bacteroidales bacterium]
MHITRRIISIIITVFLCNFLSVSQENKDTSVVSHKLFDESYTILLPSEYQKSETIKNQFVWQKQGTVFQYVFIPQVSPQAFQDSLTPAYFSAQNLENIVKTQDSVTKYRYRGEFSVGELLYYRAFVVRPYKKGTVLLLANYPQNMHNVIFPQYIQSFVSTCKHE